MATLAGRAALCALPMLLAAAERAQPQAMRGSLSSTARYLELRPLRQDTIPRELVTELPDGRFSFDGLPAVCEGLTCIITRSGDVEHGASATHDLDLKLWGLGVEGLSATVALRGRTHLDGALHLPRTEDHFEAMLVYAELVRGMYRVRAGRQSQLSGLGASGFDGIEVLVEPTRALRAQLYGGRSLARTVQLPLARAFRAADERDFVRGRDAYLLGGEVAIEAADGSTAALRYQSEIWSDRAGLLSERALLTGRTTALRPFVLAASTEYDVGLGRWGTAVLDAQYPLPSLALRLEATIRRYVPFFEYWTIWGLFSPVAYTEAELRASWNATTRLGLWGSSGYRRYGDHGTQTFLRPLEGRSFRSEAGARVDLPRDVRLNAAVRVEGPVGAFNLGGDVAVDWRVNPRVDLALHGVLLQQIEEFRVGAGVVGGGGAAADVRVTDALSLAGGLELYRQTQQDRPGRADWTQRRAWLSIRLDFGRDPGMPRGEDR